MFFEFVIKICWECVILNLGGGRLFLPTTSLPELKRLTILDLPGTLLFNFTVEFQLFHDRFENVFTMLKDF